ncbi:hypothetical protein GCM10020254_81090 [Streptomyces goshikiensis]
MAEGYPLCRVGGRPRGVDRPPPRLGRRRHAVRRLPEQKAATEMATKIACTARRSHSVYESQPDAVADLIRRATVS